jgi:hypothetical protein
VVIVDSYPERRFKKARKLKYWRDGRVVDCGGLENRCTVRYRGFESLSLRLSPPKLLSEGGLFILRHFTSNLLHRAAVDRSAFWINLLLQIEISYPF